MKRKEGCVKKFEKIYTDIKNQFQAQMIKTGDQIPTASELMETYEVSRLTVSKALKILEEEGLLLQRPGVALKRRQ